jgi:hypothetical protein
MRRASTAWQRRLLAAVTALALAVVGVVGAYAHAAGHALPAAEHAAAAPKAGDHAGHGEHGCEPAATRPGHTDVPHDCDGAGHSPLDCCDSICHGGPAILAAYVAVPHPALHAALILSAAAFDGAGPAGLDRPPKPFRLV